MATYLSIPYTQGSFVVNSSQKAKPYSIVFTMGCYDNDWCWLFIVTAQLWSLSCLYNSRSAVVNYGMWDQVHVDHGKEFYLMLFIQEILASHRHCQDKPPYHQTTSTNVKKTQKGVCWYFENIHPCSFVCALMAFSNLKVISLTSLHPSTNLCPMCDKAFSVAVPQFWNTFPLSLRQCASLSTFKARL